MRVLFLAWRDLAHPQAGGSEIVVDRLARGLASAGHETALLCGGPVGERPYPVVNLGGTYGQYLRAPFAHRRFRDWDLLVDVSNGLPYFAPLWRAGPCVCFVHHVHTDQWRERFPPPLADVLQRVERRGVPRLYRENLFVAVSESTASALKSTGVDGARIRIVHNGVDVPPVAKKESSAPLYVVIARLVPHKRIDLILRVWENVRPRTGGRLIIVGDGPERKRLETLAGPGTAFLGRVSDRAKYDLLAQAWVLVHASHHEGWGMAILEAAAAGTPALALDAPGVRDAVVTGRTGWLASDEDELAAAWVALTSGCERRRRLGEAARRRAEGLTWDRSVREFLSVAEEAVAINGRPSQSGVEQRVATARSA